MGSLARTRIGFALALVLVAARALPARANEVSASEPSALPGVHVHPAAEVLAEDCTTDADGRMWFRIPGGAAFELVTSTSDPAIANPGDGAFHPFDAAEVQAAIAGVSYPLAGLDVDVYLLPYPRRGALTSAAGHGLILLSPGVAPISREQQHAEFVHELGHAVQYQWMPDGDSRWSDYCRRRGIDDATRFNASAPHADRPHEIFAEDFRSLFGGTLANYSGSIENSALAVPAAVPGLATFMLALPGVAVSSPLRLAGANPARGAVGFARAGAGDAMLDLFDVSGRRIATLSAQRFGGESRWTWSGRADAGHALAPGVLLARARDGGAPVRFSWMP